MECLPGDIPTSLDVDISELGINDAIHIKDLPHTGSLKFLEDENSVVAHVTNIKEDAALTAGEGSAAGEPEVTKGKGKPEAAAAAPKAAAPKK